MGVYREYKSSRDPKKFLERFSKNINPTPAYTEEAPPELLEEKLEEKKDEYEIPVVKSLDYEALKKKCQEFLLGIISEEQFESLIDLEKSKLEKFSKCFDNFGFKNKNLSWERELQIKNKFLKALAEYDKGLEYLIDYTVSGKKTSINSALQLITSGGEKFSYIKELSGKETREILEELKKSGEVRESQPHQPEEVPPPIENKPSPNLHILSNSPLFEGLSEEELKEILLYGKTCTFEKDEIFYQEGMEVDRIYIIISGSVMLYKELSSGGEEVILHMDKGDCLGDMGVIDGGPHSTNARAISDKVKLLYISREDFIRLLNKYGKISMNLNRVYCYRMRDALNKISIT